MQGVFSRMTDIVAISLVNLLSQAIHELVRLFYQKLAPLRCFDGAWLKYLLLRLPTDFGYVVHVNQAADLIVVKNV